MSAGVSVLPEHLVQAYCEGGVSIASVALSLGWSRGRVRRALAAVTTVRTASQQAKLIASRMTPEQRRQKVARAHAQHMANTARRRAEREAGSGGRSHDEIVGAIMAAQEMLGPGYGRPKLIVQDRPDLSDFWEE